MYAAIAANAAEGKLALVATTATTAATALSAAVATDSGTETHAALTVKSALAAVLAEPALRVIVIVLQQATTTSTSAVSAVAVRMVAASARPAPTAILVGISAFAVTAIFARKAAVDALPAVAAVIGTGIPAFAGTANVAGTAGATANPKTRTRRPNPLFEPPSLTSITAKYLVLTTEFAGRLSTAGREFGIRSTLRKQVSAATVTHAKRIALPLLLALNAARLCHTTRSAKAAQSAAVIAVAFAAIYAAQ